VRAIRGLRVLLLALVAAAAGCGDDARQPALLRLATTTSAEQTGLLPHLFAPFEAREGVKVLRHAVGTGQALQYARDGNADLVLVHDRKQEEAFVAEGAGIERREAMWNDFLIAGPQDDPAGVRGMRDAAAALAKIAATKSLFASRGDKSGTHGRENDLWKAAGGRPDWDGYLSRGGGQVETIQVADEKQGYVLTDRGTWLHIRKKVRLEPLVEGDPALKNVYSVVLVNPAKHPHVKAGLARRLRDYVLSEEGQRRISEFQVGGETLFHPASAGD
jgi:tungstate transport system substrate-binding protein